MPCHAPRHPLTGQGWRSVMFTIRRSAVFLGGLIIAASSAALVTGRGTPHGRAVTREALAASFDDDMHAVVYRWAPEDPRPEAARRAALLDFVYQTYDSSAWIPQSLFDRNVL